jgi:putrescine transport system substrate-binding protein
MFSVRLMAVLALGGALLWNACGDRKPQPGAAADKAGTPAASNKVLNLYIWSDYLAANTLSNFETQTGIKVHVSYFDANETLETKLLAGSSGFDVVVPTASYFERQIKAGVYLTLDKSKLPNLRYMDGLLMSKVAMHDPGNAHGVIYMWGTNGIGYNEKLIKALLPKAPLDSWRMVFDPAVASKVAKCGISVLDSPAEMMRAVYSYLGKDPNSQNAGDLVQAEAVLTKIRPMSATSIPRNTSRRSPTATSASQSATTATFCRRAIGLARPARASRSSTPCPRRARYCGSTCWPFRRTRPIQRVPTLSSTTF